MRSLESTQSGNGSGIGSSSGDGAREIVGIGIEFDTFDGRVGRDRLSGSTAVGSDLGLGFGLIQEKKVIELDMLDSNGASMEPEEKGGEDRAVDRADISGGIHEVEGVEGLEDVEEAKVNRKVSIRNPSVISVDL